MTRSHCTNQLVRFGGSLDQRLLDAFDHRIRARGSTNRSEALRDLIRDDLVGQEWDHDRETIGTVTFVYDHHVRDLTRKLTDIQHEHQGLILSGMYVHLDHAIVLRLSSCGDAEPISRNWPMS